MADGGARACDTPVRVHSHCPPARTASRGGAAEGRHDSALFKRPGSVASQTNYTSHCPSTVGRLVGRRFKPEPKLERASTNQGWFFFLREARVLAAWLAVPAWSRALALIDIGLFT